MCLWSVQPEFNISTELLHVIVICNKGCTKSMDSNVCFSSDFIYTLWPSGL